MGLGDTGFWVCDLETMRTFYTRVMGLTVSGEDAAAGIVCLSSRSDDEHHEFVLQEARTATRDAQRTPQVSWRVDSLETLRAFHRRFRAEGIEVKPEVTRSNAIGIYFFDPEGNRNEVYLQIEHDLRQPFRKSVHPGREPELTLASGELLLAEGGA